MLFIVFIMNYFMRLQDCSLSQIVRLINSFPFLSSLYLTFDFYKLEDKGQILPKPRHTSTRCLDLLYLNLIPGVSGLIAWLLTAEGLLARLETLILDVFNIQDCSQFRSSFDKVQELCDRCGGSVQDFRLYFEDVPPAESVPELRTCGIPSFTLIC